MADLFNLKGRTAVVVGGAGGLGQAIAEGLADAGVKVLISSRRQDALDKAAGEIKAATGADVETGAADATSETAVEGLLSEAVAKLGKVDILVNAQGFNKKQDALEFDIDVFRQMYEANVVSFMITAKVFGKHFKDNGYGKIVNLSSVRGKIATKASGNCGYCSTKGAVDMLTKQLASEYGQYGVTVNAIGPTLTATPMMIPIFEQRAKDAGLGYDEYLKQQGAGLPLRRFAVPQDIVGTALFLSSEASDFLTGNIIYPDGGLTAIG
jgi:gluconate 5-dehydrogenase